ncbi:MAG: hypothetical protein AB7O52_11335 [Planctomycetota bacterium]
MHRRLLLAFALIMGLSHELAAQGLSVPITSTVQTAANQVIGTIDVTSIGAFIQGEFELAPGFEFLDDWYDFRWINVETGYLLNGNPVDADGDGNPDDPVVGELPAIDPQIGQAVPGALPANQADDRPFYFNEQNWSQNQPPGIHVERDRSTFIDQRFDQPGPGNTSVIQFETYLVAVNVTDPTGLTANQICVLAGFSWSYSSATNSVTLGGNLAANPGRIDTALGNANPAYPNPAGAGAWDAVEGCELNACPLFPVYLNFQGIPNTPVGTIEVTTAGAGLEAGFQFAPDYESLDDWYDFRWVNIVVAYFVNGAPVDADGDGNPDDPVVGELPAVDPQVGQNVPGALPAGLGDNLPFYFNDANWNANQPAGIHVERSGSTFVDARFDDPGPGNVSVILFETYLVARNLTDATGWPAH